MKLFLIEFEVKFKDGKEVLTIKDKMVVPAKSDKSAQSFFLKTVQSVPVLLMSFNQDTRIMAPIKDLSGEVSVLSCKKL